MGQTTWCIQMRMSRLALLQQKAWRSTGARLKKTSQVISKSHFSLRAFQPYARLTSSFPDSVAGINRRLKVANLTKEKVYGSNSGALQVSSVNCGSISLKGCEFRESDFYHTDIGAVFRGTNEHETKHETHERKERVPTTCRPTAPNP